MFERMKNRTKTKGRADFELVPVPGSSGRQLRVVRPEVVEPWEDVQLPNRGDKTAITARVEGSYTDRAKGFSLATWQLSTVTGVATWSIAGQITGAPLLSLAVLAWALGGYFAVWLTSYAMHVFVSPEGVELFRAVGEYRLLREEQKERHNRNRKLEGRQ